MVEARIPASSARTAAPIFMCPDFIACFRGFAVSPCTSSACLLPHYCCLVTHSFLPCANLSSAGPLGDNFKDKPLLARLNWLHVPLLTLTPIIALIGLFTVDHNWKTWLFAFAYYKITGLGITAGYHRLWAHKSYSAHPILQWFLMLVGSGAVEGSIRWWSRGHRAHHRYVDTDKDPYSASRGFFYAHIGWMLVKQDNERIGKADISDLNRDPIVRFQHKMYLPLALFMAFIVPTLIAGFFWGDYYGGYFIAGVLRLVCVHHSTFFVNSLAHFLGDATYTDNHWLPWEKATTTPTTSSLQVSHRVIAAQPL
jgi:fatty-acid desaturase